MPHLNEFLSKKMCKEARKMISVPYLCVIGDTKVVIGYFTLSSGSIERDYLTPRPRKEVPYSTVPCILLGRIAVCKSAQGHGLGKRLLGKAIQQAIVGSQSAGVFAMALRAEEHNWDFYKKAGFIQSNSGDRTTFFYSLRQAEQHI
ncbi:GNAT family N-acetyltransferase [Candidatus Enterovibrio escicola]|uniref:GNAT family N-acetyltransferase n=1 Tax=Candidatus Enterovibrio escicola TaxID=1927127 RepID=UPI001CC22C33|nr:GNAT family N-acetyltransferase [Candidatus Enterovibrio escacola]